MLLKCRSVVRALGLIAWCRHLRPWGPRRFRRAPNSFARSSGSFCSCVGCHRRRGHWKYGRRLVPHTPQTCTVCCAAYSRNRLPSGHHYAGSQRRKCSAYTLFKLSRVMANCSSLSLSQRNCCHGSLMSHGTVQSRFGCYRPDYYSCSLHFFREDSL